MAINVPTPPRGEPVALRGACLYFTSWKYVRPGGFRWVNRGTLTPTHGPEGFGLWGGDGERAARYEGVDLPRGIRLEAQRPSALQPLPPSIAGTANTLIHDGARYRLWYEVKAGADPEPGSSKHLLTEGHNLHLALAESADGRTWDVPDLGLYECHGSRRNNVVFRGDLGGSARGFHGGSVFLDPSSAAERYKLIYLGCLTEAEWNAFAAKYPADVDAMAHRGVHAGQPLDVGLCGAVSPDGRHWTTLPEPLAIHHCDTQNTCYYDLDRREYVAYVRSWQVDEQAAATVGTMKPHWAVGRRSIGRAYSRDYRHFSRPEIAIAPGADLAPSHLWYTNAKTTLPGAPDQHVMFPWRWELEADGGDTWLFSSADGVAWAPVPGGPVLTRGAPGSPTGGYIVARPGLVALPDDQWALPYRAHPIPHKYPGRNVARRQGLYPGVPDEDGLALWPRGRLVALVADGAGEFATVGFVPPAARLRVNASLAPAGELRVGVHRLRVGDIAGRGLDDCDELAGDGLALPVTWGGETDLRHEGAPIMLRFRLRQARLFGVEFY